MGLVRADEVEKMPPG